jgi:hypothetical protein
LASRGDMEDGAFCIRSKVSSYVSSAESVTSNGTGWRDIEKARERERERIK